MNRRLRRLVTLLFLPAAGLIGIEAAVGQPTNAMAFERLALDCFGSMPGATLVFKLTSPDRMPFIRSALIGRWTQQGYRVFLADSVYTDAPDDLAHFSYRIEDASLEYDRLKKKRIARTIDLALTATLAASTGEVLHDDTCRRHFADTLAVADLNSVESSTYPETQAPLPKPGWVRRIMEPMVLTAATVVGVYLFFTLRSDRSNEGS